MMRKRVDLFGLCLLLALGGCVAPSQPRAEAPAAPGAQAGGQQQAPLGQSRAITMSVKYETTALAPKAAQGIPARSTWRLFNAGLFYVDGKGATQPYLAASLPSLNSDTWRVASDGRMEVTYKLKPGLTWHDGQPLTADDYAFSYRAYTMPGQGVFSSSPQNLMEALEVRDPQTFVIRWSRPYPYAANFDVGEFEPLPRHILEEPLKAFEQDPAGQQEAFANHLYWTREFVGAGPYKLDRWEPGSSIEGVAFDGHALGRPRIDRVIVRIIFDENTVLSNILAENIEVGADYTLRYEHASVLNREWSASKKGMVQFFPATVHYTIVQFRPEFLKAPELLDLRVRRAMAHALDRDSINDALFEGNGLMSETYVTKDARYYAEVDRTITKYPYDPRRSEQLMNEAGLSKDRDGFFTTPSGQRFRPDFWVEQGTQFERELALMTETWTRAGFEVQPYVLPSAQVRDNQVRATFPALSTPSTALGERNYNIFWSGLIGSPANRWAGSNRGAWSNAEYDRMWETFSTALEQSERDRQAVQMMRVLSDNVPAFMLYFNIGVLASLATLRGPDVGTVVSLVNYNIHEWELR